MQVESRSLLAAAAFFAQQHDELAESAGGAAAEPEPAGEPEPEPEPEPSRADDYAVDPPSIERLVANAMAACSAAEPEAAGWPAAMEMMRCEAALRPGGGPAEEGGGGGGQLAEVR